jgi:hypothetical protein
MTEQMYWCGPLNGFDDFGRSYKDVMYDAKTKQGPWANMTEEFWKEHGYPRLGVGYGQKYVKQSDGRWLLTEGLDLC